MRKYLYLLMVAVFASLSLGLASCGNDDDDDLDNPGGGSASEIVGIWEVDQVTTSYYTTIPEAQDYYNHEDVEYGSGEYWEFTSSKVTIHDDNDVMNGKAVKYSYNKSKNELNISGGSTYKVSKLNSTKLTLVMDTSDGQFGMKTTIKFTKQQ